MDESRQPGLQFDQIFLMSAHFEHRPDALSLPPNTPIETRVKVDITAGQSEDKSRGLLTVSVSTVDESERGSLYRFQVTMGALVSVDAAAPNLEIDKYLGSQGPASMFPFLREAVANLTGRGRFGPVWLRPLNLKVPSDLPEGGGNESPKG